MCVCVSLSLSLYIYIYIYIYIHSYIIYACISLRPGINLAISIFQEPCAAPAVAPCCRS